MYTLLYTLNVAKNITSLYTEDMYPFSDTHTI